MADYLHGAYGSIDTADSRVAVKARSAIVYVGTAPVHLVGGGSGNVNKPVVVNSISEAKAKFGYSDDFASYTLCEAMKVHLQDNGVGPLILINVFDPAVHISETAGSASLTPANGRIVITDAEDVCVDTLTVKAGSTTKVLGTDYAVAYNESKKTLTVAELTSGALGTSALTVTWTKVDASKVDKTAMIGSSDGLGKNKGIYAVKNVYAATGYIPSFLMCPGFSSIPDVHNALMKVCQKINGHWDAYVYADLPITDESSTAITLSNAATWKETNGFNRDNETVFFPMAKGTDGRKYHLSVLAAANLQALLIEQDGIPYKTASNTGIAVVEGLYMGEDAEGEIYDDEIINEKLCRNGIASAAFVGGRWAIWGAHSASYSQSNATGMNVAETAIMMMYYISNDFQNRRCADVDKPMTANDLKSIVSEEQGRLDALVQIGALTYAQVSLNAERITESDIMNGDYSFSFAITTTPLAKSLTAVVTWTKDGFATYYEAANA